LARLDNIGATLDILSEGTRATISSIENLQSSRIGESSTLPINSNNITVYRGTKRALEIQLLEETGYVMSDAARQTYIESIYSGASHKDSLMLAQHAEPA
jgi:hypothetical protein